MIIAVTCAECGEQSEYEVDHDDPFQVARCMFCGAVSDYEAADPDAGGGRDSVEDRLRQIRARATVRQDDAPLRIRDGRFLVEQVDEARGELVRLSRENAGLRAELKRDGHLLRAASRLKGLFRVDEQERSLYLDLRDLHREDREAYVAIARFFGSEAAVPAPGPEAAEAAGQEGRGTKADEATQRCSVCGLAVVRMTEKALADLLEYSCSLPTGTTIGKQWKRKVDKHGWRLGEYVEDQDPNMVGIIWRCIEVVEAAEAAKQGGVG